ncbi:hypothetical protein NEUTE1DRAFT_147503 [Neurospora tetrasperma FGSC 2508]|uniref:Uncharacterized protein n=1 Tax=Neurospora tetrasperma (strain FGSC 2508 / ATCC MYA-4615 / P0657) TaxID=510951 RepID=F8MNV3_NEUT8|nr:uncharacterized protein NEUTE1DRAFT_147503 [Neurospora tetrasperma FGSC 2508]EGO57018.1 hypothetical protein NEUTE1DRAFT_147503 [Neurospora tetrasperma FGSC 2508]
MGVVFIESGLGAGQRQDGKRTAKKMKLEAGPVRSRSEEQLAFRTVPDMDFMVLRFPGQSAPSFSIEADPEKSWSCKEDQTAELHCTPALHCVRNQENPLKSLPASSNLIAQCLSGMAPSPRQTLAGLTWHRQAIPRRVDGSHGRTGRQSTFDNNIVALLARRTGSLAVSLDLSGVRAEGASGTVIPFWRGTVPDYFSDHCDNASNLPRPRKLRSSVFRDVWENWWIGQGAPRPAEIHRGHPLGPEMGLKMEISRQKEMGPSKLAPNDRGTWVQLLRHFNTTFRTAKMITRESQSVFNFGRGAYDTTGVPKPPQPPKPSRR